MKSWEIGFRELEKEEITVGDILYFLQDIDPGVPIAIPDNEREGYKPLKMLQKLEYNEPIIILS